MAEPDWQLPKIEASEFNRIGGRLLGLGAYGQV
jgi:hypothetical protein